MTRTIVTLALMLVANTIQAQGLPLTDQLGGGSGNFSSRPTYTAPRTNYSAPRTTFRPQYTQPSRGFTPQHAQQIANAAQQLGPALQQARQNLQQIRQRNGGYLIPRNNRQSFAQPQNRYTDADRQGARWAANSLRRNGYRNVQVQPHPHNQWRQQRGLQPLYGVFHNGRR